MTNEAEKLPEWHRVEDRLPPKGRPVLIRSSSGYTRIPCIVAVAYHDAEYRPKAPWRMIGNEAVSDYGYEPTHWRELTPFERGEEAPKSSDDSGFYACAACGSRDVHVHAWANPNTKQLAPEGLLAYDDWTSPAWTNGPSITWCTSCKDHTDIVEILPKGQGCAGEDVP